jgi:ribosome-binding ATPase YchF (GTP1/OBG family)
MLIGIVGKANVGKSTFFKALTLADILIANYPFATIDPNKAFAFARIDCVDTEFETQCNPRYGSCVNHQRFLPVEVMDVAGLVPGAHEGKGLGLTFLDNLREADAFIHVVDMAGATNEKGEPIDPGSYDPANDIKFLEVELDMWVWGILKKGWEKVARTAQQEKGAVVKALGVQLSGLNIREALVEKVVKQLGLDPMKPLDWSEEDMKNLATQLRKQSKPMVIAANKMDLPSAEEHLKRIREEFPDYMVLPCSGDSELSLKQAHKAGLIHYLSGDAKFEILEGANDKQREALEFIQKNVLDKYEGTGVQKIVNSVLFDLLKYISVFPGGVNNLTDKDGNVLPDCFLIPEGSTALDFAFRIHTDIGKGFIRAVDVKKKQTVGKDHQLKHRDVIEIITNR